MRVREGWGTWHDCACEPRRRFAHLADGHGQLHPLDNVPEDHVLARALAEPIKAVVVVDVHEYLRAAGVGLARVGHRERPRVVCVLAHVLILDVAAICPRLCGARLEVLEGAVGWATRARNLTLGVFRVRAAKLVHESRNHCRARVEHETLSTTLKHHIEASRAQQQQRWRDRMEAHLYESGGH